MRIVSMFFLQQHHTPPKWAMGLSRYGSEAALSFFYYVEGGKFMVGWCRRRFTRRHFRHSDLTCVTRVVPPLLAIFAIILVVIIALVCSSLACTTVLFLLFTSDFVRTTILLSFVLEQVVEEFVARRL